MNKEDKNNLYIECPHCFKDNKINFSTELKCKHCEKSLMGQKYKRIFITAFTAILLGSGIGVTADSYINVYRASVKTEYKMMKTCINEFGSYSDVRDTCACAVESMSGLVDAEKARWDSRVKLRDLLYERYQSCKD